MDKLLAWVQTLFSNIAGHLGSISLPGIGDVLADRILAYRKTYGKFSAAEQLMDVEGIGEAKFAKLKNLVTVRDS